MSDTLKRIKDHFTRLANEQKEMTDAHLSQDWYPNMGADVRKVEDAHKLSPLEVLSIIDELSKQSNGASDE